MVTLFQAFILGIIEGITEFLPISSTGHLLVASEAMGAGNTSGTYEIVIQAGAVLAVLLFYRRELLERARSFPGDWHARRFWFTLLVAFLPAAVVGLALNDWIDALLANPGLNARVVAWALILGGIVLWWVDRNPRREVTEDPEQQGGTPLLTFRHAFLIGIAQCFALIPGMSRSGSTIVGGLLCGLDRKVATEFSFYLALPTLGAATAYKFLKDFDELMQVASGASVAVGVLVAFVTSMVAMGWLLRYVSRHDFKPLAIYRIVAGVAILAWASVHFAP